MAAPSFNGAPVWFKVPPSSGGDLIPDYRNYNYPPGPFDYRGKQFWVVFEYVLNGSNTPYTIVAYKSTDRAKTQPLTRIPSAVSDLGALYLNTYWDGSSRYAYLTFLTGTGAGQAIKTMIFDMEAEAYSSINDPGVTVGNDFFDAYAVPLANGNLVLVWDLNSTPAMFGRLYSGGVWSGTVVLPLQQLLAVQPIGNKVGIFSTTPIVGNAGAATVFFDAFDGVTVSGSSSLAIPNPLLSFGPWSTIYDPVHDTVSCSIPETYNPASGIIYQVTIFSLSPADGSGGVITRTVVDNDTFPIATFGRELQFIGAKQDFSEFYLMIDQGTPPGADPQLFIYTAPAITGPWSAQSVFYNQATNNATPPGLFPLFPGPAPLIYAFSFRVLQDNSIGFTAQFIFQLSGQPVSLVTGISGVVAPPIEVNLIFCGVVRFLIRDTGSRSGTSQGAAASAGLGQLPDAGGGRLYGFPGSPGGLYAATGERDNRRFIDRGSSGRDSIRPWRLSAVRFASLLTEFAQPVAQMERETKDISIFYPQMRVPRKTSGIVPKNWDDSAAVYSALQSAAKRCNFAVPPIEFAQPVAQTARETKDILFFYPQMRVSPFLPVNNAPEAA